MSLSLSRTVRFRAAHHYHIPEWSEAENRRTFGENVFPHEHEYEVQVTVAGEPDPRTGFLVDLGVLDGVLEVLVGPLRASNLTESIAEARDGGMIPSTENLARWFFERLRPRIPSPAHLVRVRVSESDTLSAEFAGG